MKKVYDKPAMTVVAVHQQQTLLNASPQDFGGPSSDFMSNPTIRSGGGVKKEMYNVWDDDWNN